MELNGAKLERLLLRWSVMPSCVQGLKDPGRRGKTSEDGAHQQLTPATRPFRMRRHARPSRPLVRVNLLGYSVMLPNLLLPYPTLSVSARLLLLGLRYGVGLADPWIDHFGPQVV